MIGTGAETPMGCHPERSEGSQSFGKLRKHERFAVTRQTARSGFAPLRMTNRSVTFSFLFFCSK
jgi:hypothetical protein